MQIVKSELENTEMHNEIHIHFLCEYFLFHSTLPFVRLRSRNAINSSIVEAHVNVFVVHTRLWTFQNAVKIFAHNFFFLSLADKKKTKAKSDNVTTSFNFIHSKRLVFRFWRKQCVEKWQKWRKKPKMRKWNGNGDCDAMKRRWVMWWSSYFRVWKKIRIFGWFEITQKSL